MTKLFITVKTSVAGFHCWAEAPEEVAFLRNKHRHLFNVSATIRVSHHNRSEEFFLAQKDLKMFFDLLMCEQKSCNRLNDLALDFAGASCERIAEDVLNYMRDVKGYDCQWITVSEDGESDGTAIYQKDEVVEEEVPG